MLDLTDRLAKQVLEICMNDGSVPSHKIMPLLDVAALLRAYDVEWPMSLRMAIEELRQGVNDAAPTKPSPELVGSLDHAGRDGVSGWAIDPEKPGDPVELEIVVDGRVVDTVTTDRPRPDVSAAGFGGECQGFSYAFGPWPAIDPVRTITVRRRHGGAVLASRDLVALDLTG